MEEVISLQLWPGSEVARGLAHFTNCYSTWHVQVHKTCHNTTLVKRANNFSDDSGPKLLSVMLVSGFGKEPLDAATHPGKQIRQLVQDPCSLPMYWLQIHGLRLHSMQKVFDRLSTLNRSDCFSLHFNNKVRVKSTAGVRTVLTKTCPTAWIWPISTP